MNRRHEGVTAEAIEAQMEFIQSTAPGLHPTELANIKNALSHKAEHTTASVARIRELLEERTPFYKQADVMITTEGRPIREVAQQVANQFHMARKATP